MAASCPNCRHPVDSAGRNPGEIVRCARCRGLVTLSSAIEDPEPSASTGLTPGDRIGDVLIRSRIGNGSMGAVYEVVNERLCREAAVKVLMPYVARQHEHFSLRFERECRLASAIKHPNLVEILEYGFERARGLHYMVMELVRGSSLSEKLLNGPFEEAEALRVVRGVARALSAIGRNGVVHRDVKPGNILLGPEGVVKLTDLGLAKSLADEQGITGSFATLGSMHYMSPEQVTDARKVDPRADLFSLGSTLYAMLTGHSPFEGGNLYKVSERIVREPHVDPRVLRPEIGPRTVAVLDRLLAKNPEDRFPDGDGVLEALDEAP